MRCSNIDISALESIEVLHNETTGPSARMMAWRAAIRATMEVLGVPFEHYEFCDRIKIKKG